MSTPINKPRVRLGLSRQSGSSKKFTPPCLTSAANTSASTSTASTTTPDVSTKKASKSLVIQKRKLEFAATAHIKQEKEEVNYEKMDLTELRKLVEEKRKAAEIQERHEKEQEELKALIEKWKQAGRDGLEMLIKIIQPTPTMEALLDDFKMPHDVFE